MTKTLVDLESKGGAGGTLADLLREDFVVLFILNRWG
jgi:hypothetical protein